MIEGKTTMKKLSKTELKKDWLNWFKLAVVLAREKRLSGNILYAQQLDLTVERYYLEAEKHEYSEDFLFELETDIRNDRNLNHD